MQNFIITSILWLSAMSMFGQQTAIKTAHTDLFLSFFSEKQNSILEENLTILDKEWQESDEILALETAYFLSDSEYNPRVLKLLQKKTGKSYGRDFNKWYEYIWNKSKAYTPDYYAFKGKLHQKIDPKFLRYFYGRSEQSNIRLDEVRWGGVLQDGIPPLRNPEMIHSTAETYLDDNDVVFGIEINGDVRAYPKRILAWHEMFTDTIGGVPVAGVYCTLCGTVIPYKTTHENVNYSLGTSGFLYRSNKMMYDKKTQSLWSTHSGKPIIGPLVNKGIELEYLSVVTTNWKTWKERHPDTKVLSLNTGHRRDYGEGVAYHNYFSTDKLMFNVPKVDTTIKNKDEVLVVKMASESEDVLAIASKYLKKNTLYKGSIGDTKFTIFTDKSGAHRAFLTDEVTFKKYNGKEDVLDEKGNSWVVHENMLTNTNTQNSLKRLHTYNAFWFGLQAAYPDVKLIY